MNNERMNVIVAVALPGRAMSLDFPWSCSPCRRRKTARIEC